MLLKAKTKKKYKVVVSDLHLGKGRINKDASINVMEDFIADREFEEFVLHYSTGEYENAEVEIILNGDILNNIQVDYRGYVSPVLTEDMSLEKLKEIIEGHPQWFKALRDFAALPGKEITYVVGNHDVEMIWEACQEEFAKAIGAPVRFYNFSYYFDGIHLEHGQQHEIINRLDPKRIYLSEGLKKPILNLPWGSHFVINFVIPLKKERAVIDKVRPLAALCRWGLINDTWWFLKTAVRAVIYFIGTRFSKSLYRTSNLVTTIKILKELHSSYNLDNKARKILKANEDVHTVIFGHTHGAKYRQYGENKEYLNSGTWTESVSLELSSLGKSTGYNYILIDYTKNPDRPRSYLREWRGEWHTDLDTFK